MIQIEKSAEKGTCTVRFRVSLKSGAKVMLVGSFNDWDADVQPMEFNAADGVYECALELPAGYYEYKLIADGEWMLDESNPNFSANDFGTLNSVFVID